MKKLFLLAIVALASTMNLSAQDILTKQNGEDLQVVVKEVDADNVKYVLYSEPNGVVYTMPKSDILMVRYASGRNEVFGQQTVKKQSNNPYAIDYGGGKYIHAGMKYNELKNIYHHSDWRGGYEKYSPFWCGFASFFIPGLGQICAGEGGRGLGFWGTNLLISTVGLASLYTDTTGIVYLLCSCANLGLGIWSIVDASQIAKVKNMYETDMRSAYYSGVSIDLYPSVNPIQYGGNLKVAPGMTLAITF